MLSVAAESPLRPDHCVLHHRLFAKMGEVSFRRSVTDEKPVMAVTLGEREALIPLRSLQREFDIPDDSEDGRMLAKVAEALDFVSVVQIGDRLPAEVLTGDASWEPDAVYVQVAAARLRLQLVHWVNERSTDGRIDLTTESLQQIEDDPAIRQQVQRAITRAAEVLDLDDPEELVGRLAELGQELAYIEALRDRLLRRVQRLAATAGRMDRARRSDSARSETVTQIVRLTAIALKQIAARFDELDAQTADVMTALRDADSQRTFIRSARDWLYRSQRAWMPLLAEWDEVDPAAVEGLGGLLNRTYQFLAVRFMPVTEWLMATRPRRTPLDKQRRMVW